MSLREIAAALRRHIYRDYRPSGIALDHWADSVEAGADAFDTLQRQYEVLLEGYHRQEQTMKEVAARLREEGPPRFDEWADELDPQEPVHPDDR